ncbi:MAG TPA: Flp pilus assembly protein CpaB [Chloroflexota bacterium]|nr:Flp pilus assembly protein CpaB [Chloroflexota bacterium]
MNRRRIGVTLIVAGMVLAGAIGFLVYQQASAAEELRAAQPRNFGVVALVDIPERTTILAEQLDVIRVPDEALPPGDAVYRPPQGASDQQIEAGKAAAKAKVVGQLTGQRIYKGEVINTERLGKPAEQAHPALQIPQGKVWYHLPISAGSGGKESSQSLITFLNFVRPGDFIDIYYTTNETPSPGSAAEAANPTVDSLKTLYTRRILQLVKVINVGLFPPGTPTGRGEQDLTLEVTPDQALVLKWLKDAAASTGSMEFVVRSPQDPDPYTSPTVNFDVVSQQTGIGTGR